jgi:hypothetical protein
MKVRRRFAVHLHHWEPAACGGNGLTFSGVRLLPNPQRLQLSVKRAPVNYPGAFKAIFQEV